jgi:hypothetical protein
MNLKRIARELRRAASLSKELDAAARSIEELLGMDPATENETVETARSITAEMPKRKQKPHWTQTEEGRRHMRMIQKRRWRKQQKEG